MSAEPFELMLTGGHPNSLGRTIEVVDIVLADQSRFEELYLCYQSEDEVVRLRTSNAMKRIAKEQQEWLVPYLDRFLTEITALDQASAQWTLAQLFLTLRQHMSETQFEQAQRHLQKNLAEHNEWIVLNQTMATLGEWSRKDEALREWLRPHLERLEKDSRNSIAKRAHKLLNRLY